MWSVRSPLPAALPAASHARRRLLTPTHARRHGDGVPQAFPDGTKCHDFVCIPDPDKEPVNKGPKFNNP